jgi:selenocysteine lyase/cysteine desulfurase
MGSTAAAPQQPVSSHDTFAEARRNTIGYHAKIQTPYGAQTLHYCDYTASGRLYAPIERRISEGFGPLVGNTHTESNITGTTMTTAYHHARDLIKRHVNAGPHDVLISTGFGMTSAVNKLQRILGLRVPELFQAEVGEAERPVVFTTHMEHHSNQITWLETIADVVVLTPDADGLVCPEHLETELARHGHRAVKIGSFTACSNVTGIRTPYHQLAAIMHRHHGICFVDFAAGAPYQRITMHPDNPQERLDGIFFSPHKFLGGPGSPGILIFDSRLYHNRVPDTPGGGTVEWTNPWGGRKYIDNIELREDGGTPGFLQTIRAALAIVLKEKMGTDALEQREREIVSTVFDQLEAIPGVHVLAPHVADRIAIVSFYVEHAHYNLFVRLLNDRFGVQARGGCSCAGTYGHYLLNIDERISKRITDQIERGDLSHKPGWVRLSFHPMMTPEDVDYAVHAVREIVANIDSWKDDYRYDKHSNEFVHRARPDASTVDVASLFDL